MSSFQMKITSVRLRRPIWYCVVVKIDLEVVTPQGLLSVTYIFQGDTEAIAIRLYLFYFS